MRSRGARIQATVQLTTSADVTSNSAAMKQPKALCSDPSWPNHRHKYRDANTPENPSSPNNNYIGIVSVER